MITVNNIQKRFGSFDAVNGVSIVVPPGEIHGFLGPNGAGKTTTIRMIAGLLKPTSGSITIDGADLATEPEKAKAALGFLPDRRSSTRSSLLSSSSSSAAGSTGWKGLRSKRARWSCSSCSSCRAGRTS